MDVGLAGSRWIWIALVALACSPAGTPAGPHAAPGPPSILLVTLDTTRADRLGTYGRAAAATPTIDRLAREGVLFEYALASVPITLPSHATILTGVSPPVHGARDNALFVLGPQARLVSEALAEHGWRTGAFVGSYVLDASFGLDQGFEVYRGPRPSTDDQVSAVERRADAVVDDAVDWLSGLAPGERFFAWVHFYDPHKPYVPLSPWAERIEDPHDAEIAFCDNQLDRLLRYLASRGLDDPLLVVVTADHGEGLGEHGEETHALFLYDATLHVPLILSGSAVAGRAGTRIPGRVSTLSVAPTLLAAAGLPAGALPAAHAPPLLGDTAVDADAAPVYVETYYPYYSFRWRAMRGLVWEDHKLIEGATPELYDLAHDPGELHDLASSEPARLARMRGELQRVEEGLATLGWASQRSLDPRDRQALEALGYLTASGDPSGAANGGEDPLDASLPDPRQRVGDVAALDRSAELYREALRLESDLPETAWQREEVRARARALRQQSRDLLRGIAEANPDDPMGLNRLGVAELELGNTEVAVPLLEKAARERPTPLARFMLGVGYLRMGRDEDGVREIEGAIELDPKQLNYYWTLAVHHHEAGNDARAAELLETLAGLVRPGDPLAERVHAFAARLALERGRGAADDGKEGS